MRPASTRHQTPGRLTLMAAGVLLILWGCAAPLEPMTQQLIDAEFPFDTSPQMLEEFDAYAKSPPSKAFAVAMNRDGTVHAWAKA